MSRNETWRTRKYWETVVGDIEMEMLCKVFNIEVVVIPNH